MKNISKLFIIFFVLSFNCSFAQLTKKEKRQQKKEMKAIEIKQLVNQKQFVFKANSLTTNSGFNKNLSSDYDLTLKKDSVIAYLPFWGKAYTSSFNDEGGIKFSEKLKEFENSDLGKKGQNINFSVKTKDDTFYFNLNISSQGFANVTVTSTNKSQISYYGQIEAIEEK